MNIFKDYLIIKRCRLYFVLIVYFKEKPTALKNNRFKKS